MEFRMWIPLPPTVTALASLRSLVPWHAEHGDLLKNLS
jgi:hypothetical protein